MIREHRIHCDTVITLPKGGKIVGVVAQKYDAILITTADYSQKQKISYKVSVRRSGTKSAGTYLGSVEIDNNLMHVFIQELI